MLENLRKPVAVLEDSWLQVLDVSCSFGRCKEAGQIFMVDNSLERKFDFLGTGPILCNPRKLIDGQK